MNEEEILKEQEKQSGSTGRASLSVQSAGSADYGNTMAALRQAETTLPVFQSSYDAEISDLYSKIVNRRSFQYSPGTDPLYGAYKEQYNREGRLAMRDSMGEAAALTGGYGSSYAQTVGREQYDSYLAKLNDIFPELYSAAYEHYENEGQELRDRYAAATGMEDREYGRFRDSVGDRQYQQGLETAAEQTSYDRQQAAFATLMDLISKTGYQPSAEELGAAGMAQAQTDALRNEYLRTKGGGTAYAGSSRGGGGFSGKYGGKKDDDTDEMTIAELKFAACEDWGKDPPRERRY